MKKIFKPLVVVALIICVCFSFVGCKEKPWSPTTNNSDNVISNGGIVAEHNGWLYFVNGTKSNNEENNKGQTTQAGIYRVKLDEDGNIAYKDNGSQTADSDKDEEEEKPKEFLQIEPVVRSIVGFNNGSIHIFGDYLYYATPCKDKNKDGNMLINKTEFRRLDLVNGHDQKLYTTKNSSDTISYAYYKLGASLNFVIYEKNAQTLTSILVEKETKVNFVKEKVTSAVMSENFGEGTTDKYIFYTLSYDQEGTVLRGNRVYRICADGSDLKQINTGDSNIGISISLLAIKADKLLYSVDSHVYAMQITAETTELVISESNVVCYGNYENTIFFEDESGNLSAVVYDNSTIRLISWKDGKFEPIDICNEFDSNDKVTFIGLKNTDKGNFVVYLLDSLVYKVKISADESEEISPIKLSTTKINSASNLMTAEILGDYIYGFNTDSSVTYMYRININTPKDLGEEDTEIKAAEFIGVKE